MNVVLLGIGLQGRAVLHDLVKNSDFKNIIAIDNDPRKINWAHRNFEDGRVKIIKFDISQKGSLDNFIRNYGKGVIIDMLPASFMEMISEIAVNNDWHYVNTNYTVDNIFKLDSKARDKNLTILPEFGLDPGIDLVMAKDAISKMDTVKKYNSYGAGIPEKKACTNPLKYKISWNINSLINSYSRKAKIISESNLVEIPAENIFDNKWIHKISIENVGQLEAFPNGDVEKYLKMAEFENIEEAGRYTMRWPGHSKFWNKIAKLGLLKDKNIKVKGKDVPQRTLLAKLLDNEELQYKEDEKDLSIIKVNITGNKDEENIKITYDLIDERDFECDLYSMQRTVGFAASIGAQMIEQGSISKRGIISPLLDIDYSELKNELEDRDIKINEKIEKIDD
ncbi:MAG: hypothetical protein FXF47_01680 [Candidatus Mcinerneyibacterium aminivorans]|jgi:saccharopine dehydrogenase-like NADP-dependent oxidoreductase|uniref:Saccharopine dehydrogenase n=1 Tax=Candidatus Mcinerneyibacterium aminivorans TaxID=2703815 RepID=A0A5D0ME25_9BACT|nr:MAG: hypothetical protein FXF47_01680 [Candidatus Mcinerneyibacterium aminivorans]